MLHNQKFLISLSLLITTICLTGFSQKVPDSVDDDLFDSNTVLELTLRFNRKELLKDINEERSYHPSSVTYAGVNTPATDLDCKIATRGNFRRASANCDFPPLQLNFQKATSVNTIFEGYDKLKLVTHCRSKKDAYEQYVLKEYLAYKIYNEITEYSFKVRLVKVRYVDSTGTSEDLVKCGFLIEPKNNMAQRNGMEILNIPRVHQQQTDPEKILLFCLFEYLIGNTDWSVPALHNVVLIGDKLMSFDPIAVPFDFDWSGIVNASYAVPDASLKISSVRERLYRGFCRPESEYASAIDIFINKKSKLYALCYEIPGLDNKQLKQLIDYIDQFYQVLENQTLYQRQILSSCRTKN